MSHSLLSLLFLCYVFPFASPFTITIPLSHSTEYPSSDPLKILNHLASLSLSRAHHLKASKTNFSSVIKCPLYSRSYGVYSMPLSFGTPPQTIPFIMDTGSSTVWFPCTSHYRCDHCDGIDIKKIPKFIPELSSSSKFLDCKHPKCQWFLGSNFQSDCNQCHPSNKNCSGLCPPYVLIYGKGSTSGRLLLETLHFPNKIVANFLVGCSYSSAYVEEGIVGFGRGRESLPLQLGAKKFSYCLQSRHHDDTPVSSDLILDLGPVSGKKQGLSYTPFSKNPLFDEYYYVMLRKIIIGVRKVKIPKKFLMPGSISNLNGGTIVDSGTTFTVMEGPVFELVTKEFEKQMANCKRAKYVEKQTGLRPCFNISGEKSVLLPKLIFQFKGGAKMNLPRSNYIYQDDDMGVACFAIMSYNAAEGGTEIGAVIGPAIILGSFQQQNYYIEYDLKNERLGFKKQRCA